MARNKILIKNNNLMNGELLLNKKYIRYSKRKYLHLFNLEEANQEVHHLEVHLHLNQKHKHLQVLVESLLLGK